MKYLLILTFVLCACARPTSMHVPQEINNSAGQQENSIACSIGAQGVVASVGQVDPWIDWVMLTVSDYIEPGDEFIIHRGDLYVVRVTVIETFPTMAACLIDKTSWNILGLDIELGDAAMQRMVY